ncbi:LPS-assembly lipoprotein [Orbus hercynius]|uniref:LPS-assembly lipoprotein LptE n=1 Tax=Orbus hercynius TaxID=593135 RepID=A0A495RHG8_9GAMM|nr:LPS assembly lipoprotein LptE [Orbus hercynius]RKS86973.1 LPS-assembly lipoprotein [Orbus hercynius]
MKKWLCLFALMSLLLSGCGFHLQGDAEIPKQFQTMAFYSSDPYGSLSREIKKVLRENNVQIVNNDDKHNYPALKVIDDNMDKTTISIYPDGKSAEYQLTLMVNAQVIIAGSDIYPLTVKVFRTFFDNPASALAKSTEQYMIEQEMYSQAAIQLIGKLKSINMIEQKINTQ